MLRLVKVGKGEMFDGIRAGLQKCLRITYLFLADVFWWGERGG